MDAPPDFTVLTAAGVGPGDLAKLLKINRVTCSSWLNGHTQPHRLIRVQVDKMLDQIGLAVEAGHLPVPHRISRRERGLYIQRVVEQVATAA